VTAKRTLPLSESNFVITSTGTVNGRSSTITAKYGFLDGTTNGLPLGSQGPMNFNGARWVIFGFPITSHVYADGPIESASSITPSNSSVTINTAPYVQFNGDVNANSGFVKPSFWQKYEGNDTWSEKQLYDTNGDHKTVNDTTGKGYVNITDAGGDPLKIDAFNADNINGDDRIDTKDAFIYYYTVELNSQYGLGINPGGAHYYQGNTNFGPSNVTAGTSVVFVNGSATILYNAQQWWGNTSDITIISTRDITIVQPVNGPDDKINLVALGNIATGGINLGDIADVDGNINMYSEGNFTAILGGNTNGAIFAGGAINVTTVLPSNLFNRDLNRGTDNWINNSPIGLPQGFRTTTWPFAFKAETFGNATTTFKPRWQQR
jgi:hypothetical protein